MTSRANLSSCLVFSCFVFLGLVFLSGCKEQLTDTPKAGSEATKPLVLVTNYPLYFFTSEIAGDAVEVIMPDIDGDPAMWVPGSSDLAQMQNADLLIINGAGYESWLAFTSLPSDLIVDTTAGIQDQLLPIENSTIHQHGPQGEHSHEGTAFTTWLNPLIAIEQARVVERKLSLLVPAQAGDFVERLATLEGHLESLDQSLAEAFSRLEGQAVIFSHPVYQYLQQQYDLNARSVHWEPETEPGVKQWVDFQNMLRGHPARLMIWEGQPSETIIERLRRQGISSAIFDAAANRPVKGDYFTVMRANLEQFDLK